GARIGRHVVIAQVDRLSLVRPLLLAVGALNDRPESDLLARMVSARDERRPGGRAFLIARERAAAIFLRDIQVRELREGAVSPGSVGVLRECDGAGMFLAARFRAVSRPPRRRDENARK